MSALDLTGLVVLIVDDLPDAREMLGVLLGALGATVLMAGDGREALRQARRHRPDLILSDLNMPVMDGFELMRRIRASPTIGRTRVVAVTGRGVEEVLARGGKGGFDGHLLKPFTADGLAAQLLRVHASP
jgi:CheY-like chemotaxis protein